MSTEQLKRCPFCGGHAASHHDTHAESSKDWRWEVACMSCKATITGYQDEAEAMRDWNRRVPLKDDGRDGFRLLF